MDIKLVAFNGADEIDVVAPLETLRTYVTFAVHELPVPFLAKASSNHRCLSPAFPRHRPDCARAVAQVANRPKE